jgi:tetratricopeptide (TPR) repeat protein
MPKRSVSPRHVLACIAACFAFAHSSAASAQTWREIRSPHFTVITDGSDSDGRNVAKEFEQMRSVFATRYPRWTLETGAPLLIIAVREDGLRSLAPIFWKERDHWAGEFFQGWERRYAMVRLDSFGDLNQAVIFHEYTHSIFHANLHWLPTWLDEGLAEFYGYTRFQNDHIYIGAPTVRYGALKSQTLIPISEMLTANDRTFFKDQQRQDLFYAQSWAMVHYIAFGPNMENGAKLNTFVTLLEKGTPQPEAFQQAFGDLHAFQNKLSEYLLRLGVTAGVMPPLQGLDPKSFPARVLTKAEADYYLGSIDLGVRDVAAAKTRLEAAEAADPNLAGPHEELGFLAWRAGHDDEARQQWQKAVAADPSSSYRSSFALLMSGTPLKQQTPEQLEQTKQALQAISAKAPKYAPAVVEIALIEWRQGHLNQAYQTALSAEKLEPWRAEYHLLTGRILLQGHQPAIAATFARQVADRWPGSDHDEAVDLWSQVPPASRGDGPPLALNLPPNATVARGTILSTSCSKLGLTVVLQPADPAAPPLNLITTGPFESGFADTLWVGEDHYTSCYHLAGLPAVVAYTPSPSGPARLMVFEVRDDFPTSAPPALAPKAADAATLPSPHQ